MRTLGELEAAICAGVTRFEQEYMGRGPKSIHTYLLGDLLVVRLQGVLTAAEQQLVKSLPQEKGRDLIKQVRTHLVETARPADFDLAHPHRLVVSHGRHRPQQPVDLRLRVQRHFCLDLVGILLRDSLRLMNAPDRDRRRRGQHRRAGRGLGHHRQPAAVVHVGVRQRSETKFAGVFHPTSSATTDGLGPEMARA